MQYLQIKFSDSVHGKSNETLHFIPMSKVDNFRLKDCVLCRKTHPFGKLSFFPHI